MRWSSRSRRSQSAALAVVAVALGLSSLAAALVPGWGLAASSDPSRSAGRVLYLARPLESGVAGHRRDTDTAALNTRSTPEFADGDALVCLSNARVAVDSRPRVLLPGVSAARDPVAEAQLIGLPGIAARWGQPRAVSGSTVDGAAPGAVGGGSAIEPPPPGTQEPPISLRKSTWYRSAAGAIWVQGEVVNHLRRPVSDVRIRASFHAGTRLEASVTGTAALTTLPGLSATIYTAFLPDAPAGIDRVTLEIDEYRDPVAERPVAGLVLTEVRTAADQNGWRQVSGAVRNTSTDWFGSAWVHLGFYDEAGDVVRTGLSAVAPGTLGPGGRGSFEALGDTAGSGATACRMWVDARRP